MQRTTSRPGVWRSRWAAVGAAVAVTLGAGGMVAVNAAPSEPSSFVSITPIRILDTRTDVGLNGPFESGVAQTMPVTGIVPTQPPAPADPVSVEVVPSTATSVVLNVTVVNPQTKGFLSVRPGDATGDPATSNINWAAGGANIANAVTVQLPTAGDINIFVNGTVGEVLIDVAGYNIPGSGVPGPQGDVGPQGPQGPIGPGADQFGTNPNSVAAGRIYDCVIGELKLFAGIVGEGIPAEGQLLQIAGNTALFSVMGTNFGGDGRTTFGVPDMRPAAPNGTAYYLCDAGIFPSRR